MVSKLGQIQTTTIVQDTIDGVVIGGLRFGDSLVHGCCTVACF